jgi:hypothetical protein
MFIAFGKSNAVRSRLYFQTAKASDGTEPDKILRTLTGMKNNYGKPGETITLEWKNGLFVPVHGATGLDKMAADAKADDLFLTILKRFNAQNRNVSDKSGTSFAPALFAKDPDGKGLGNKRFDEAMNRLFKAKKIRVKETGPVSRRSRTLIPEE